MTTNRLPCTECKRPGGMTGTAPTGDPRFVYAVLTMLAGPSNSGILLTAVLDGRDAVRALGSRALRWRVRGRWYAVALLMAPLEIVPTFDVADASAPAIAASGGLPAQ